VTPGRLRVQLLLLLTLAGVVAFLSSFLSLVLGMGSMALRYPLAVACGYAAFVLLIRGWIAWQRHGMTARDALELDPGIADGSIAPRASGHSDALSFAGGRSGGAGSGGSWSTGSSSASPGIDAATDVDDLWPVVVAAACVLGGLLAMGYVVYGAPVLLAEVAVDAAIVSGAYRSLRKREPSYWAMTVLRHTAIPAMILVACAALGGFAAEQIAPDARSIGGVIRALTG
jgi:hypothetical protein